VNIEESGRQAYKIFNLAEIARVPPGSQIERVEGRVHGSEDLVVAVVALGGGCKTKEKDSETSFTCEFTSEKAGIYGYSLGDVQVIIHGTKSDVDAAHLEETNLFVRPRLELSSLESTQLEWSSKRFGLKGVGVSRFIDLIEFFSLWPGDRIRNIKVGISSTHSRQSKVALFVNGEEQGRPEWITAGQKSYGLPGLTLSSLAVGEGLDRLEVKVIDPQRSDEFTHLEAELGLAPSGQAQLVEFANLPSRSQLQTAIDLYDQISWREDEYRKMGNALKTAQAIMSGSTRIFDYDGTAITYINGLCIGVKTEEASGRALNKCGSAAGFGCRIKEIAIKKGPYSCEITASAETQHNFGKDGVWQKLRDAGWATSAIRPLHLHINKDLTPDTAERLLQLIQYVRHLARTAEKHNWEMRYR